MALENKYTLTENQIPLEPSKPIEKPGENPIEKPSENPSEKPEGPNTPILPATGMASSNKVSLLFVLLGSILVLNGRLKKD